MQLLDLNMQQFWNLILRFLAAQTIVHKSREDEKLSFVICLRLCHNLVTSTKRTLNGNILATSAKEL